MNTQVCVEADAQPAVVSGVSTRLFSLDVLRGITVAGMILVTDPGTYSAVYPQLLHAQWTGATLTDMIFPCFLFMTGVALTFSFASRMRRGADRGQLWLHVLKRCALLVLIGLVLNGFPDYHLHTIRIPGILQRIALCYLLGSFLYLATDNNSKVAIQDRQHRRRVVIVSAATVSLLALYWLAIKLIPVPGLGTGNLDSYASLPAYVDRSIFSVRHLWPWGTTPGVGVTYDPEGLLSTLPATSTLLFGVLAGEWVRGKRPPVTKALGLAVGGLLLCALGLALSPVMPIIKRIWTPSFALFSAGFSSLAFAVFYFLTDVRGLRKWVGPARVFGMNAILAFVISTVITALADRIHVVGSGPNGTIHAWCYERLFATWMSPIHASLSYAILIVLINLVLLYPLYRKHIVVRI